MNTDNIAAAWRVLLALAAKASQSLAQSPGDKHRITRLIDLRLRTKPGTALYREIDDVVTRNSSPRHPEVMELLKWLWRVLPESTVKRLERQNDFTRYDTVCQTILEAEQEMRRCHGEPPPADSPAPGARVPSDDEIDMIEARVEEQRKIDQAERDQAERDREEERHRVKQERLEEEQRRVEREREEEQRRAREAERQRVIDIEPKEIIDVKQQQETETDSRPGRPKLEATELGLTLLNQNPRLSRQEILFKVRPLIVGYNEMTPDQQSKAEDRTWRNILAAKRDQVFPATSGSNKIVENYSE